MVLLSGGLDSLAGTIDLVKAHGSKPYAVSQVSQGDKQKQSEEIGDLLFVVASLARKLEIDPEQALKRSLQKFHNRFNYIERQVLASGKGWQEFTLDQLEAWWTESKRE